MLKVWLPLNGDLHNQGLDDVTVTNNGATVNNEGKIGKCYSFNGSSNYITITQGYIGDSWSYSIWAYTTSGSSPQTLACCRKSVGSGFSLFLVGGKLRIDSGGNSIQHTTTYSYPTNTWFHLTITYGDGKISYYINGEFKNSYSDTISSTYWGNIFSIGASQANGSNYGNYLNGRVNDIRIYDHCLSPKEVKELSKGLVLHYPLNRGGFGADNLFVRSDRFVGEDNAYVTINARKDNYITAFDGKSIYTSKTFSEGDVITLSAKSNLKWSKVHATSGQNNGTVGFWLQAYDSVEDAMNITNLKRSQFLVNSFEDEREEFKLTWTVPASDNGRAYNFRFNSYSDGTTLVTAKFWDLKLELGDHATPWIPNPTDDLYSALGLDDGIEYDVSGYQNNGTITGSLTCSSDTPRYMVSTYFNGGDNAITVPFNSVISDATIPFTINLWFKKSELGTDNYESLFGGPSGFEMDTRSGSATSLSLYMASTRGGAMYSPFNLNEWYMVTMASDRTNEYYYVNGELAKTITAKSMPVGSYFIGAWQVYNKQNYKGLISDFRIYSTCLSADDILALYNIPASIASNGTLLTQGEISEV